MYAFLLFFSKKLDVRCHQNVVFQLFSLSVPTLENLFKVQLFWNYWLTIVVDDIKKIASALGKLPRLLPKEIYIFFTVRRQILNMRRHLLNIHWISGTKIIIGTKFETID